MDQKMKVYHGALFRYHAILFKDDFVQVDNLIIFKDDPWNETIGSYKFVDNGDGTYNSYIVDKNGRESPLSRNKPFTVHSLQSEVESGFLVLAP